MNASVTVLTRLMETAASLLIQAGDLGPISVLLNLRNNQIQLYNTTIPLPMQRSNVDRIAEVLDATPKFWKVAEGNYAYTAASQLDNGVHVLAMARTPSTPRSVETRSTTTSDIANLLRSLTPWAALLELPPIRRFVIHDLQDKLFVQLLVSSEGDRESVTSVLAGLPSEFKPHPLDPTGTALLTTGHTLTVDTL